MTAPVAADVFSSDLVAVQFNQEIIVNTDSLDPASYVVTPDGAGKAVTVQSVLAGPAEDEVEIIYLVVTEPSSGEKYTVTLATTIVGTDGVAIQPGEETVQFVGRATKVDRILNNRPAIYTLSPSSVWRNVLTAIGRSDDLIGGNRADNLPAFPAFVPPPIA